MDLPPTPTHDLITLTIWVYLIYHFLKPDKNWYVLRNIDTATVSMPAVWISKTLEMPQPHKCDTTGPLLKQKIDNFVPLSKTVYFCVLWNSILWCFEDRKYNSIHLHGSRNQDEYPKTLALRYHRYEWGNTVCALLGRGWTDAFTT